MLKKYIAVILDKNCRQLLYIKLLYYIHLCFPVIAALFLLKIIIGPSNQYLAKKYLPEKGVVGSINVTDLISEYPNFHDLRIQRYVKSAIIDSLNMDFDNMDSQIEKAASTWFSTNGGIAYKMEITNSGIDMLLRENLGFMNVVTISPSNIIGKNRSTLTWLTATTVLITFRSQKAQYSFKALIEAHVQYRELNIDPKGLGIVNIKIKPI